MKRTLLALLVVSLAGCLWRGVDDLGIRDAELVVIVTGTLPGDSVLLEVDGDVTRLETPDEREVRLYLQLDAGEHEAELRHVRAGTLRCAEFEVEIVAAQTSTWSVDVRLLPVCSSDDERDPDEEREEDAGVGDDQVDAGKGEAEDPDGGEGEGEGEGEGDDAGEPEDEDAGEPEDEDAGEPEDEDAGEPEGEEDDAGTAQEEMTELVRLRAVSAEEGCTDGCVLAETRIESDGSAVYTDADGITHVAVLAPAELAAVVADTLSSAADLLFEGDDDSCPVGLPSGPAVELERRLRVVAGNEESFTTERVDVTDCGGIAADLREHLANARERALGDNGDAGP